MGDFADHFGDRLVEIAVSPHANRTLGLYVVVVTLLHSYLGTQIEASFGSRRHDGPGKAEHFVALIAYALAVALFPELSFPVGDLSVSLPTAFLAVLGVSTLAGVVVRLVRARQS